MAGSCGYCWRF